MVCRSTHTPLDRTRFAEAWQPSTFLRDLILGMAAGHSCVCSLSMLVCMSWFVFCVDEA